MKSECPAVVHNVLIEIKIGQRNNFIMITAPIIRIIFETQTTFSMFERK